MIHKQQFPLALVLLTTLITSCVLVETKEEPSSDRALPQYWLTVSMFTGPFYDDDKQNLIDYRSFSSIDYVEMLDGKVLYPPRANKTIPAGTLVKIQAVTYPNEETKRKRPLYSPKDNIWVYLRVAKERGNVTIFDEKTHILIIPKTITTEPQLRGYLSRFFSSKDPNRWILQLESSIQDAIFQKRPVIGMNKEQLVTTLGPAIKKQFQKAHDFENAQEIWHYYDYLVVLTDGAVSKINKLSSDDIPQSNLKR